MAAAYVLVQFTCTCTRKEPLSPLCPVTQEWDLPDMLEALDTRTNASLPDGLRLDLVDIQSIGGLGHLKGVSCSVTSITCFGYLREQCLGRTGLAWSPRLGYTHAILSYMRTISQPPAAAVHMLCYFLLPFVYLPLLGPHTFADPCRNRRAEERRR